MNQDRQWYIIYTSGIGNRAAKQIQSLIDRLDLDCLLWVPSQKTKITRYGKEADNNKPIFPSYVFIYAKITDCMLEQSLMENKLGKFLKFPGADIGDDLPAPLTDKEIEDVKACEESGAEPTPEEIVSIAVGDQVEILVGPFIGVRGNVIQIRGHDVHVETFVFGRSAPVQINATHLLKLMEIDNEEKA